MTSVYLCIHRMRVKAANAFASGATINTAPITAAVLFGHALSRRLDEPVTGVAYLHHDAQILGDKLKGAHFQPQQRRGASFIDRNDYASTSKHTLSLQPTASCHLTVTLIFRLDEDAEVDMDVVFHFLRGGRFAGGDIVDYADVTLLEPDRPLAHLPGGFWLIDRNDLLKGCRDSLSQLTKLLSQPAGTPEYHSWLTLTCVGFAGITHAQNRDYVRANYPHFFSEPVLGLTQFVSRRRFEEQRTTIPFWVITWPTPTHFLLQQN